MNKNVPKGAFPAGQTAVVTIDVQLDYFRGGAFPLWLSPIQAVVIPISQDQNEYAQAITKELLEREIRVENWNEAESMQNRIRKAEQHKIPYMLIVGRKEVADQTVSVRTRQNRGMNAQPLAEVMAELQTKIANQSLE